jgi:hypothetical protein
MAARRATFDADALPLGLQPHTVFVTGKGGVGKSTVSAALALAWRDAGARTLLVEIEGQASAASMISTKAIGYEPVPLAEHLAAMRITLMDALREYARQRLKVKLVADRLVGNPIIDQFAQAAPGFRELLVLGKLWSLATSTDDAGRPAWDAIVVDSPATGHGLGLLGMAGVIARMFPVGPIAGEAKAIDAFVRDPAQVGVVLVALLVDRFSPAEAKRVGAIATNDATPGHLRHALDTVIWEHVRCVDQATERQRLEAGIGDPVSVLPYMFAPQLEREHVASLARWLTPAGQTVLLAQLAGAADGPAAAAAVHAGRAGD